MIKLHFHPIIILFASLLVFASCAKEVSETSEEVQRRVLDAYLRVHNYQDIEPLDDGLYIIDSIGGYGEQIQDSCFVYVRYSVKFLSGDYSSTTYDSVAKLTGKYKIGNYYGDYVWGVGNGTLSDPIEKILKTMRVGGKTTSIVPPWLTSTTSGSSDYYVSFSSDGNCLIYELEVMNMVLDIDQHQIDILEDYSDKHYRGIDSLSRGFYCVKTYDSEIADTLTEGETFFVDYVGRFLDGTVFDTNVEDTAKKYRLYQSTGSYSGLSLTYYPDSTKLASESNVVLGFAKAVTSYDMTYGDKCVAFFDSNNGYGASGSISDGKGVPGYTPMLFEIRIRLSDE